VAGKDKEARAGKTEKVGGKTEEEYSPLPLIPGSAIVDAGKQTD